MDFFSLNFEGASDRPQYCFAGEPVEDGALRLGRGRELTGFIANSHGFLILSAAGVRVVRELCTDDQIKVTPLVLLDRKGKVLADDYARVEPRITLRCLHPASDIYGTPVLSKNALADAPHLFRMLERKDIVLFSRQLGRAFNAANVSNVWGSLARVDEGVPTPWPRPKAPKPPTPPKLPPAKLSDYVVWQTAKAPRLSNLRGVEPWRLKQVLHFNYFDYDGWPKRATAAVSSERPLPDVLQHAGFPLVSERLAAKLGDEIKPLRVSVEHGRTKATYFFAYPSTGATCLDLAKAKIQWTRKPYSPMVSLDKLALNPRAIPVPARVFWVDGLPQTVILHKALLAAVPKSITGFEACSIPTYTWRRATPAARTAEVKKLVALATAAGIRTAEAVDPIDLGEDDWADDWWEQAGRPELEAQDVDLSDPSHEDAARQAFERALIKEAKRLAK